MAKMRSLALIKACQPLNVLGISVLRGPLYYTLEPPPPGGQYLVTLRVEMAPFDHGAKPHYNNIIM